MKIITKNIVDLWQEGKTVCVTTNGFVKKNGIGVMGRGNALAMATVIPQLPALLGKHIRENGNVVGFIYERVIAFPVKPTTGSYEQALNRVKNLYKPTDVIPGFHCKADINLITESACQLINLIERENINEVYLPIPGVGNGELDFRSVVEILKKFLNHKVIIVNGCKK